MAEPTTKTLRLSVDQAALDKIGMRYFAHVELPTGRVVDVYYNDLFQPMTDADWERYALYTARIKAQQVTDLTPTNFTTHEVIKARLDGDKLIVKPLAEVL